MKSLLKLWREPWALLRAGYDDLRHPPPGNRPALDVLRSLAILLVLFFHIRAFAPNSVRLQALPFVRFGWTGVDLFFVLSGLLIGGQLWKELKNSGTVQVGRFILRRGFRIWPLYYLVISYLLAQQLIFGRHVHGLWLDASFLSNYYFLFPVGGHAVGGGWSLSLEEQFYLVVPILLAIGAKLIPPKWLVHLALVWLIALPFIRHATMLNPAVDDRYTVIYYPFQTHSDGLAVGLLLAWLLVWKPGVLRIGRWLDLVLVLVFLGCCYLWYVAHLGLLFSVVALAYGALTLLLLRLGQVFPLRSTAFYVISRLSYGVYLLHLGVLHHMHGLGEGPRAFVVVFLLGGGASLALAFLTFSLIELPFLKMRERLIRKSDTMGDQRAKPVGEPRPRKALAS